jgi:hypothetical protein
VITISLMSRPGSIPLLSHDDAGRGIYFSCQ